MAKILKPNSSEHNLKYQKNHRIIQKAFIALHKAHRWHITIKQILGRTKLTKRTLYIHYPDLENALTTIEKELINDFKIELQKKRLSLTKITPDNNRRYFFITMLYMSQNKDIFAPVCNDIANYTVLYRLMEVLYPLLEITWFPLSSPAPRIGEERVNMYITMCVEILSEWGFITKCDIGRAEKYLRRLLRLTRDASLRCQ